MESSFFCKDGTHQRSRIDGDVVDPSQETRLFARDCADLVRRDECTWSEPPEAFVGFICGLISSVSEEVLYESKT